MVDIKLAGINVDIDELAKAVAGKPAVLTPETITAAYARISRSQKDVNELTKESAENINKARKSNDAIIYGLGHHSVADHAIFNLNITNASRLLVESIEERRIGAGYTEKSQRYVTLDGDCIIPQEYSGEDRTKFLALVELQNDFYFTTNKKIMDMLLKKHKDVLDGLDGKKEEEYLSKLEGMAKEDARYSLSLATKAQLGDSYNGQAAELAIRKLKYGRLLEEHDFADKLFSAILPHAPSLIQLVDPELFKQHNPGKELDESYFKFSRRMVREYIEDLIHNHYARGIQMQSAIYLDPTKMTGEGAVTLIRSNDVDKDIIASIIFSNSNVSPRVAWAMSNDILQSGKGIDFIKQINQYLGPHDKLSREFEMNGGPLYAMDLSSSAFAQIKRHRMMTLISQDYNPLLGITIPQNVIEAGADDELEKVCRASTDLYNHFLPIYGKAAEYVLTNAHRRSVLANPNMRELYHISRMREDAHAQWDIKALSKTMSRLAKKYAPISSIMLGGKHEFTEIRKQLYES